MRQRASRRKRQEGSQNKNTELGSSDVADGLTKVRPSDKVIRYVRETTRVKMKRSTRHDTRSWTKTLDLTPKACHGKTAEPKTFQSYTIQQTRAEALCSLNAQSYCHVRTDLDSEGKVKHRMSGPKLYRILINPIDLSFLPRNDEIQQPRIVFALLETTDVRHTKLRLSWDRKRSAVKTEYFPTFYARPKGGFVPCVIARIKKIEFIIILVYRGK